LIRASLWGLFFGSCALVALLGFILIASFIAWIPPWELPSPFNEMIPEFARLFFGCAFVAGVMVYYVEVKND